MEYDFSEYTRFFMTEVENNGYMRFENYCRELANDSLQKNELQYMNALQLLTEMNIDCFDYIHRRLSVKHTSYDAHMYLKFLMLEQETKKRFLEKYITSISLTNLGQSNLVDWIDFLYDTMNQDELSDFLDVREPIVIGSDIGVIDEYMDNYFYDYFERFLMKYNSMKIIYHLIYCFAEIGGFNEGNPEIVDFKKDFMNRFISCTLIFLNMLEYFEKVFYVELSNRGRGQISVERKCVKKDIQEIFEKNKKDVGKMIYFITTPKVNCVKLYNYIITFYNYTLFCPDDKFHLKALLDEVSNNQCVEMYDKEINHMYKLKYIYEIYQKTMKYDFERNGISAESWKEFQDFIENFLSHFSFTKREFDFLHQKVKISSPMSNK